MILKSLNLKNFRCFKNLRVDFDENVIVFIGNNGVGKTSIFEAIFYALFGFGHSFERGGKDYIIHDGANEVLCEIELIFNLDELEYKVIRRIRGKNLNVEAFLYRGDNPDYPIAERDSGVTKEIQRLLGMTYQTFKISVFSAQKELGAFTELQPEKRKEEIRKLLNLGTIKASVNLIRRDTRDNEVSIQTLKGQIQDVRELNKKLHALLILGKEEENKLSKLESHITALSEELEELKSANEELSKTRDKVQQLESELRNTTSLEKKTRADLDNLRIQIKDLNQKKIYLERNKTIKSEYLQLQGEYEKLNELAIKKQNEQNLLKGLKELNGSLGKILTKEKELLKKLEPLERLEEEKRRVLRNKEQKNFLINKLSNEAAKLEEIIKSLGEEEAEINEEIEKIKKLGRESPCPKCGRPLGDHYDKLLQKYSAELSNIKTKQKELTTKQKTLTDKRIREENIIKTLIERDVEINEIIKKLSADKGELNNVIDEKSRTLEQINKRKNELNSLGKIEFDKEYLVEVKAKINSKKPVYEKFISLEGQVKSLPNLLMREKETETELDKFIAKRERLSDKRKSIDFNEDEYKLAKQKQKELEDRYSRMLKDHGDIRSKVTKLKAEIEQAKKEIGRQKGIRKEIEVKEKHIIQLKRLEELLIEFERDLLVRIRPILEFRASELIRATTKGKYASLELDENYTPYLYDLSEKYELKRFSGGEQDLVNLCLRIAVADIVAERTGGRRINFLILDEIFGSQDEDRRRQILNTLQELTSQFRQIFLATHIEDVKDSMPIVYEVKEVSHHNSIAQLV